MGDNSLLTEAQRFLGQTSTNVQPKTDDAPAFQPGSDSFTDEERVRRRAGVQAATQVLFQIDLSKLDDDAVGGLYRASAKALFGIEDPDGTVAFGRKNAGDARHNVELLRRFCKGDYSVIRDPEYDSWRAMDEEQKFRHALENESKSAKVKGNLEGKRGASLLEMLALSGTSGAPDNQLPQETREDIQRRMDYDRLTPEEQEVYRRDVIGRYDRKIAKEQVLATYLAAKEGMSDRAAEMLASSYNRGEVDVDAVEALSDEDKDRFYTALSIMRGDQKKGHLLGIPTDFTDDTAVNRGQLALYGLQQSVLGLVSDTWEVGSSAAKWAYAKTLMDDQARKDYFRRWNAEARAKTALEQGLPEADTWMGEMVQALGENSHWFIPYAGIAKGGKMAREAAGTAGALLKSARAAKGAADLEKGMVNLWARQFASIERFTDALRDGAKAAGAVKGKMAGGAAMWTAGEASAFSAFANEYISNCDAAGVSREESVPMSAIVGLVNAKIESLYVPGLESALTPAQVKNLMMASGLRALKSDGAAGFRMWLGNYVEKGLVEGAKVTLTEGAVEEPLQQFVQEWGKEIAQSAEELKKSGRGELGLALGKFVYDNFAADGGFERFAQRNLETYVETAVDMIPSSVGFGLTTNGRQKLAQHRRNRAVRKMNMARWRADVAAAEAAGREAPPAPLMLGLDEQNRMTFNPNGVDYDEGVVDLVQREIDTRRLVGDYWEGKGETEAGPGEDNRYVQAMTEARRIWRSGQGDKVNRIAEAAGVDHTTAEVIAQYLQTEQETAAFSPRVREYVGLAVSAADFSEETIRTVLPGYVDGSFMADDANGVYTAKVKLGDGSERTIAYKVGDLSDELKRMIHENERPDSEFGRSYDAQLRRGSDRNATPWVQLSDAARHKIATDAALGTYGMTEGSGGVFQMTDAKGNAVTVNADEIVRLSNGKLADIGYTALATMGTARHETFHALWKFAAASYTDAQLQETAKALGLDVTADTWKVDLDEEMAHQMEEYASGHYVSHIAETRIEKLMDTGAGWFVRMFGKLGLGDEVKNAKTGRSFALKDFYDAVLNGEIGFGELGVRHTATEAAAPKAEKGKAAKSGVPVAVTDEERAQEAQDQAQAAAAAQPAEYEQRPEAAAQAAPKAEYTLDSPADATVPDARFYRVQAGDGVDIVGELVVSDANELKTSYKGTLEDGTLQNRAETEEGWSLVEKIAGNPDPLQVGTVQPRANNGFIWATPSGNVFIGNTRETGITHAYARGNAENVRAYMINEARKRGLEIPEGVENPIVHFVLRDIQSKDGTAGIQDVVRLTNESVNRGMNVYEQAKNDADVMLKEKLVPGIELRADGRIDTERSAAAIGAFRRLTNAQGMIDADTGLLTEEGQTRLSNAVLAAFLASEDPTLTQKVIRDAGRLDMENERRALMRRAADLMALAEQKPQYDLRGPIAEALRYFTEWREADEAKRAEAGKTRRDWYARTKDGQRRRGIAWQEHMAQQDMFRRPSPAALIIGDLLAASRDLRSFEADDRETEAGKTRAQELVSRYLADFAQNARSANTETDDLFGAPPATVEEMLKAQRTKDGQRRFSVRVIGGHAVAVVDDLDAARRINPKMPDDVEKYVLDHLEDGIAMMAGGEASVNAETAHHFAWSRVRGKYKTNRRMRKARAQSAIVFRDLVEMFRADASTRQEDYHKRGEEVWRCRLPFGVPQFGVSSEEVAGGVVYDADVIIKDEGDGKFLYDVSNLKKNEALTQLLIAQAHDLFDGGERAAEAVSARAPTKVPEGTTQSVPPSAGNVNGENFKRWFAGSKIVDADGKPLVVYRGASFDPLAKEPGKGVIMPGAYFTADPEYAKRYGKVNAYYLNIRNPLDVRNPAHAADLAKLLPPGYKFATGPMGALDWGEMASFDTEDLKEMGYDGIILDEGADYQSDGTLKNRGISYVPFDGGTQVKSATDNNGDYSLENRDVRFSIANLYTGSDVKIYNEENAGMSVSANKSEGASVFVDGIIARYISKGNGLNKMFSVALRDAIEAQKKAIDNPLSAYFKEDTSAMEVPISNLRTYKNEREKSIVNAIGYMGQSARGEIAARAPVSVTDNGDGTYVVVDGNATTWAATRMGMQSVMVRVVGMNTGTHLGNSAYLVNNDFSGCVMAENGEMTLHSNGLEGLSKEDALDKEYAQAEENAPILKGVLDAAVKKYGGTVIMRNGLKKRDRAMQKVDVDYRGDVSRLVDITGGTIVLGDENDFTDAIKGIRKSLPEGASIAQVKKLNMKPGAKGYQDIKVSIRFQNGGIGEVILVSDYMNDAKFNRGGHIVYDASRVLETKKSDPEIEATFEKLDELTVAIYARGETAPDAESFERMKDQASSSLTRLLPILGRKDLISSKDINTLKSASSEFHLAKPPSVDSYAMPASSFMKKAISNSFSATGKTNGIVPESDLTVNREYAKGVKFSYAFPRLDQMSDDQLVATAVATQMALGKSDKVSDRSVKITTVQKLIKGIHPEWSTHQVGVEALRVATEAQKLARKIREDLDRGVSDSLVLQHLPDAVREQFGQEMTHQARQGARLGAYHQRAMSAVEDKQAKVIEEAVKVQSGIETKLLENAYGVDLSQTLMNLVANPFLKKDANGLYVPAGGGEQAAQDQGEIVQADAPEKEVSDKARRAVDEVVAKSAEARAAEKANEKESERMRGRDQENASGSGGEEDASLEGADIVDIATRKQGLNLEDPRQLAHFVAELARRYWVDTHGLAKDANAWADSVAVQFLRKTAANVYGKLAQEIAYSQARDVASRSIDGFGNIPTVQGLISEMTYVGQVINARKIRETQQQLCERLDLFLREKMGAQGRFKPDNEELHRKVSAEIELRARYMRHAMWLTPDAASEEAKELQRQMDAATVDFKGEGHDAEQARVMVENLRKLNVLREFGSLRYKPVAQIEAAIQYWEDLERGSGDDIARENLDREIRTKKAAAMLAKAFHNPSRKYAREGKGVGDMLSDYLSSHMGFMNLLRDMTRYASKEDAAEAETIFRYLELEIQKAGTKTEIEKRRHAEALASAVNSIYGRDFAKVLKEFAQKDDRFVPFMGAVDGHPVPPTKGRAIQLMVSLLQEGRKIEVEDPEHPGEFIIQWEGGYHDNIVKHGREKQAAEIAKLLTPADMNLVKWLGQWYEANRQELSQVCDSLFGIGVYAETSNYFPVKMLLEKQGLEKGEAVGWSIFPRALTPRVRNERDFDTSADVLQMFMSRMEEAAQWKAHAQLGLELRGIFGRSELQAAITSNHGNKVNQTVLGFVTDTLAGKGTVDRGDNGATYYTDMVRGWAALGALGANFGVMFKQTTSIPAFGFEIGLRKTASHIATAFTPEGMAAMRKIFDSDQRKVRWNTGNTEAVKNALANSGNGPFMRLWKASMFTNRLGDCVPALVVGQGIYREALENGMSEEDAMAYTWMLVERTQQSGRIENQAQFQRRSKFGRAIYQFLSTQQQYLQYEVRALRGVVAKPGDLGKWGDLARAAVLNHFILSSAYFWMGALFKRALGQEPPEDELKDWVVSMLIGPYGALYGMGFTCTGALNEWIKGPQYGGSTSSLPSLSFVGNVIVRDPAAIVKSAFDETKTWDDVLEKMGRFGADANALFRDLRKLKKNYWDD